MRALPLACLLLAAPLLTAALIACDGSDEPSAASSPTPTPGPAALIEHGGTDRSAVALTFELNDGAGHVEGILAALAERNARATFAITGLWAEANTGLLNAIAAAGHQIINQTYDGSSFTGASTGTAPLDAEARALALSRAETTIFRNTSRSTRPYMRPPHGDVDPSVLRDAGASGYAYAVRWNIDARIQPPDSEDVIVSRISAEATAGDIIALDATSSATVAALPQIIDLLRASGLSVEPVAELLEGTP